MSAEAGRGVAVRAGTLQARLSSKGQITIPKAIRDALSLRAGDRLNVAVQSDGTVRVAPLKASIRDLKGMLPPPPEPLTLEQMDSAIGVRRRLTD